MVLDAEQIDMWDYWDEGIKDQTVPQMVKEFAKVTGQSPSITMSATLIQEEYAEWGKRVL